MDAPTDPQYSTLEEEAAAAARLLIERRFDTAASLDELSVFASQYSRQLGLLEAQLGGMVQAARGSVREAMETINNVKAMVGETGDTVAAVRDEARGAQVQGKEEIKEADINRRNLALTLQKTEEFATIPERAARLHRALKEDPASIRVVYEEARKLENWREGLFQELKTGDYTESPEAYTRILDVLGGHFEVVLELSQAVRETVKENLSRCFELGMESPGLLVRSNEVLKLVEADARLKRSALTEVERENLPDLTGQLTSEVVRYMSDAFDGRIQGSYVQAMLQAADDGKTGMEATLGAATRGLVDMSILANDVSKCFPPDFPLLKTYRARFEEYVRPQVAALYSQNVSNVEIADLLRLISWLHEYNRQISLNDAGDPTTEFDEAIETLMTEYVFRMSEQTMEWFDNIVKRTSPVLPDGDGCLVTRDPEDMLNIVNMQVGVAKDQLPIALAHRAVKGCVAQLRTAQERQQEALKEGWVEAEIETICAVANDSFRLQDKCEEILDSVGGDAGGGDVASLNDLTEAMEDLCRGYVELAVLATKFAAASVMEDLKVPIIGLVFTNQWEEGDDLISVTVKTLRDYFGDLATWLPEYFFSKLVRECYEQTIKTYVEAAFKKRKPFSDAARASQTLVNDRICLEELFADEYRGRLKAAGLRGENQIEDQLGLLTSMSKILMAPGPSDVESDIKRVLEEFGQQGSDAVMCLAGMRKMDKDETRDWKFMVSHLVGEIGEEVSLRAQEVYDLPQFAIVSKPNAPGEGGSDFASNRGFASTSAFASGASAGASIALSKFKTSAMKVMDDAKKGKLGTTTSTTGSSAENDGHGQGKSDFSTNPFA